VKLLPAQDAHFAWLLGEAEAPEGLTQPPGGVDQPWVYRWLRRGLRERGGRGQWLMVADGEVVGLCGHKSLPDEAGGVEIGYGVAPERRRLGYATRAVAIVIQTALADAALRALTAQTALDNLPSQRVLEANGFAAIGRAQDADEGEMIVWRLELSQKRNRRPNR
jgi:RimJ/RimL family protein N-acetyltransferase